MDEAGNPEDLPPKPFRERDRVLREGIWIGAGQLATALAKLSGLRILTTLLTPEVFGEVSLLLGVSALGGTVFLTPIHQATLRFYPEAAKLDRVAELRRVIASLLLGSTSTALCILLLGAAIWKIGLGGATSFAAIVLVGALLAADTPRGFETAMLNASRRQRVFALWNACDAWARPLLAAGAILLLGPHSASAVLGNLVGCVTIYTIFRKLAVSVPRPVGGPAGEEWRAQIRREILGFSAPLVPLAVLGWVIGLSDRYVLAALVGTREAGLYAAVHGLGSQPFLALSAIGVLTFRPVLFDAVARGQAKKEQRTVLVWLGLFAGGGALGVIAIHLLSRWIVGIALGEAFREASSLLPWIAGAYALQGVQHVFETMIYAQRRTRRLVVLQAAGALFSIGSYSLLIPKYGAKGAAIAVCVALFSSCMLSIWLAGAPQRLFLRRRSES